MLTAGSSVAVFRKIDPIQNRSIPRQWLDHSLTHSGDMLRQGVVGVYAEEYCLGAAMTSDKHRFAGLDQFIKNPADPSSEFRCRHDFGRHYDLQEV